MGYKFVIKEFTDLIEQLMVHGAAKHIGETHLDIDPNMRSERLKPTEIARHSMNHFREYLADIPHDKFDTLEHQLAAVAANAMMEFHLLCKGKSQL